VPQPEFIKGFVEPKRQSPGSPHNRYLVLRKTKGWDMKHVSSCMVFMIMITWLSPAAGSMEVSGSLTLMLVAGDYELIRVEDGSTIIQMDGFGEYDPEAAWSLPGRRFLYALPPGAQIRQVQIQPIEVQQLPGSYQLSPPASSQSGEINGTNPEPADLVETGIPATGGEIYPAENTRFMGQGQWRRYAYARFEFSPFQYDPHSQSLFFTPAVQVTLDYITPKPGTARWRQVQESLSDTVLEDIIASQLENYDQARQWYPDFSEASDSTYSYVIVVPTNDHINSVAPLKEWKEKIGFTVRVVTMTEVINTYPSGDNGERLWNYLHDRYPAGEWGIRYVLLVGDVDQIPMRYLYPDDGAAYGSDYYYAKLSTSDWDVDGDRRWGEFTHDNLDPTPDVIVGRIPFNDFTEIEAISNAIVNYEKDIGSWKRNVLLAHGTLAYDTPTHKTDTAVVAELVKDDFLNPYGWTSTSLYELNGISPSEYTPDLQLSQANYTASLQNQSYGLVNLLAHGNPGNMGSFFWTTDANNNGSWDPDPPLSEIGQTSFSTWSDIDTFPAKGAVLLIGCSTAAILGDNPALTTTEQRSLTLTTSTRDDIMVKEYLKYGAPAVVGSTAGSDYRDFWESTAQDGEQSLDYFIFERLVKDDSRLGDAFFSAMLTYANQYGLARGIRVFNYFGDPSLVIKGVEDRPGGYDTLVKEGSYGEIAGDYADNGDMYVAVLTTSIDQVPGRVNIYRSIDHGQSWVLWTYVENTEQPIWDVDVLVGEFQDGDYLYRRVHVVYSTGEGQVVDVRIHPDNTDIRQAVQVADVGRRAKNISLARDPGATPGLFNIYLAWEYEDEDPEYAVMMARSEDNGLSWSDTITLQGRQMPHLEAGPDGKVYASMLESGIPLEVYLYTSSDYGQTWPVENNLTQNDGASMHVLPVVAASNDPAYPSVWVVYIYEYQSEDWGRSRDLRFAYSTNAGQSWTKDQILAAEVGVDEWLPDIASYHIPPNRWVNLAYAYDPYSDSAYPRNIVWRYASGSVPANWTAQRIVNDYPAGAPYADAPLVLYSPGVGPGSGVVYGGANRNNLYFSAPWLLGTTSSGTVLPVSMQAAEGDFNAVQISQLESLSADQIPLYWRQTGDLPGVTAIGALEVVSGSGLLAAGVAGGEASNRGVVFISSDGGGSWEETGDLPEAWSLGSLAILPNGIWAAGGISVVDDQPVARIYRSANYGASWAAVFSQNGKVVYDLLVISPDEVLAATGPDGNIFVSWDGMHNWVPLASLGAGTNVHALLRASNGYLYAALETASGGKLGCSRNGGESWEILDVFENIHSLQTLVQSGNYIYVGGKDSERGWVFRGNLEGEAWERLPEIAAEVRSVTSLEASWLGKVYAGVKIQGGISATRVFQWADSNGWVVLKDELDLANAVYDLEIGSGRLYAATGYIYGKLFEVGLQEMLYLPSLSRFTR
jgi:hypothetical protein